jgi:hypothetical protein
MHCPLGSFRFEGKSDLNICGGIFIPVAVNGINFNGAPDAKTSLQGRSIQYEPYKLCW